MLYPQWIVYVPIFTCYDASSHPYRAYGGGKDDLHFESLNQRGFENNFFQSAAHPPKGGKKGGDRGKADWVTRRLGEEESRKIQTRRLGDPPSRSALRRDMLGGQQMGRGENAEGETGYLEEPVFRVVYHFYQTSQDPVICFVECLRIEFFHVTEFG